MCPDNWVVRWPVGHFEDASGDGAITARYPPRNVLNALARRGPRQESNWKHVVTYPEPPFPVISGLSSFAALSKLKMEANDISKSLSVLEVLGAVYKTMGNREGKGNDEYHQVKATRPCPEAEKAFKAFTKPVRSRNEGHPAAPKTVIVFFKTDASVKQKAVQVANRTGKTVQNVLRKLYEEAQSTPGQLKPYQDLTELDLERYARELNLFRNTRLKQFDIDHCISVLGPVTLVG